MNKPKAITDHKQSKVLELTYESESVSIPAELLRVYSPSAEVRGHAPEERKLQTGKKHIGITSIDPVGNYAVRIAFDDGHDTGLYGWDFLHDLGRNSKSYWDSYLNEIKAANASRLPTIPVGHWSPKDSGGEA